MKINKINLREKYELFNDHWNPRIIAELNGQHVKIAKVKGEFDWHSHEEEDELFFVVKGQLDIQFRDGVVALNEGEMIVVPKGIEHKPVAQDEAYIMLFEPNSTINTGDLNNSRFTKETLDHI